MTDLQLLTMTDLQCVCKTTAEPLTLRERRAVTQCLQMGDGSLSNPVSLAFLHLLCLT